MPLPWLEGMHDGFPPVESALEEPNGLLAAGGELSVLRLLTAYSQGIFPWYEEGQPVLWWSPDPRMVLRPGDMHVSRSLARFIRQHPYRVTLDQAFARVISQCASARRKSKGTWITTDMQHAYIRLHEAGYAHSVEVWHGEQIVGGLYGVALGRIFFGESMFSVRNNTSKLALAYLARQLHLQGFELIDCQVSSAHLQSLGAVEMPRAEFVQHLQKFLTIAGSSGKWQLQSDMTW